MPIYLNVSKIASILKSVQNGMRPSALAQEIELPLGELDALLRVLLKYELVKINAEEGLPETKNNEMIFTTTKRGNELLAIIEKLREKTNELLV